MNLADMLSYADIHQLNRIADHYECNCNTNSKNELIQAILGRINRKDVFETYVEKLELEDIRFLNSLLYDQRESFSLEELVARARLSRFQTEAAEAGGANPQARSPNDLRMSSLGQTETKEPNLKEFKKSTAKASKASKASKATKASKASNAAKKSASDKEETKEWSPRDMVLRFKQQGWLFNGYSHQTKYLYQVPSDLKRRFADSLARSFERRLQVIEEPPVYRDEQRLLLEDIYQFLKFVHQSPVELSSNGAMYKRTQQAIMDVMTVKEEPVGKGGWRFGYGRKINDYPNRFSLIYDYCFYNKLIDEGPGMLTVTEAGAERVSAGAREDPSAVYRFWLKLYKNPIHNIQSLAHWVDRLAQRWVTVKTMTEVLIGLVKPYYYDTPEAILRNRVLTMMMHLGLLRIGEHPESGTVVEMTKLGSSIVRGVYVPEEDRIALPEQPGTG
ncbi:hypothetical protein [Paenibacillus thermotolerans]|uniref:hypothetical protein n=1 Tax=Paenibacillus thermotolerans TaxID=3027807 RepID=UPI0023685F9E|nr:MULTISPECIES: hypothetical protein [unclassified Paenibacillus]